MVEGGILTGVNPTKYSPDDPVSLFIIQVVLIITFTRLLNIALSPLKQPRVISEVIGGIILGPSVFGNIPGYMKTVFPDESRHLLNVVADLGLIYFLFLIGVEMNPKVIMKNVRAAISISAGGISTCFALGAAVSYGLYTRFTDETGKFSSFLIFIGVAMSITAFPVLARILSELEVIHSPVGTAALTASVNDDVISWVLLTLVVSLVNSSNNLTALYVFFLCIAWVLFVVLIIRPILIRLIVRTGSNDNGPTLSMMVITLSLVMISAFVTSTIGVHPVLGGFIMGVIIPHEGGFAVGITEKIEDLISILFLPIYFALSGLKTQLSLLNDGAVWVWVLIVILCALSGKIVGCGLMARANKYTWRESLTIGIFMSCKGLIELIILNIGFDANVISDRIFVIMVVMTIVTTITTAPLATYIYPKEYQKRMEIERGLRQPGIISRKSSDALLNGKTNYNKLLFVLNKFEWLPSMMTLVKLLQPLREVKEISTNAGPSAMEENNQHDEHSVDERPVVHALRMVELTQRISAVMKFNESDELILHDPIMNVFRTFGYLNFVNIKAKFSVTPYQNFAKQIVKNVIDARSELVIIPWNGAGAIVDNSADPTEELYEPRELKDTSPHVAYYVQEVFNEVDVSVGLLINRGLGSSAEYISTSSGINIHVYFPFFGGIDDREALSFVVRLLDNSHITATIIRIRKSNEPTANDATLKKNDLNPNDDNEIRPPLIHEMSEMSTASDHVLKSSAEKLISDGADDLLLSEYFKVGTGTLIKNDRINYMEIASSTALQTAIQRGKDIVTRKDLVVVGRGRRKANIIHREEFAEVISNLGLNYGNDTRRCLGDVADAFLVSQIPSSIFIIQGKRPL